MLSTVDPSKFILPSHDPMKKKVGIFYHWFAHYREPIIREMQELLGDDYEIEFVADNVALEPAMNVMQAEDFEAILHRKAFSKVRNFGMGGFIWQAGAILKTLRGKYDVVVFLGEFRILSSWPAVLLARCMGVRTLFWSHGVYGNESFLKLKIRLMFYRLAHGMLLYGNRSRELMQSMGFSQQKLHVVFNSLDYHKQLEIRDSDFGSLPSFRRDFFPENGDNPTLVFVGRLTPSKQLGLLLNVVSRFKTSGQPVNLLVVGDGPEKETLAKTAKDMNIEKHVCFYGACHDESTLAKILTHGDLCVSPGNVGLLAAHSLVYGTPLITHSDLCFQGPEVEAIIEDKTGGYFNRGDLDSLCSTVARWLEAIDARPDAIRSDCHQIIDRFYNPTVQCEILKTAFSGGTAAINPVSLAD